eukprot:1435131-Prymnesium_polylepis.1
MTGRAGDVRGLSRLRGACRSCVRGRFYGLVRVTSKQPLSVCTHWPSPSRPRSFVTQSERRLRGGLLT